MINGQAEMPYMRKGVRRMGLRRARYIGKPRTHQQHVATAAAINMCRLHDWLTDVTPHSTPLWHFEYFKGISHMASIIFTLA
jgi:hypothetical protein